MDDAELLDRLLAGLRHFYTRLARASRGAHLVELPGVQACVFPATPERSYTNAVVYDDAASLEVALHDLEAAYDAAGVDAWTVWVLERDDRARGALERAGNRLDSRSRAMARTLDGVEPPPPDALEGLVRDADPAVLADINDRSFGFGGDSFARAFADLDRRAFHVYAASHGGRPACTLMTSDHRGNCEVDAVATLPEARGRGLAGALLRCALVDAAERGCETTSLIATAMGRPVYERAGFRDLGVIEMWERRRT
jgi:GNAT superfamily N-acetyltransferase